MTPEINTNNNIELLICPSCSSLLNQKNDEIVCSNCISRWPVKEDIPIFDDRDAEKCDQTNKDMDFLCRTAEANGWQKAFFDYTLQKVKNQEKIPEDQRCADWKFLTDFNNQSDILLFGCGLGTIPVSLSQTVRCIFVSDCVWSGLRFMNIRKKEQGLNNIFPLYVKNIKNYPFKKKSFDGIALLQNNLCHNDKPICFTDMVKTVSGFLKDTGTLVLMVDNAFSFTRFLGKTMKKGSESLQTISGYKKTLIREGFSDIRFYAPLPGHGNVPMFYVPLSDNGGTRYFLENIFGFFDMVSPEVKKNYAVEYAAAKIAVFFARMIKLTWLMKYFVPGYTIIARKQVPSI
jgi:SAM-dependent methyltransferase